MQHVLYMQVILLLAVFFLLFRRILKLIREEYVSASKSEEAECQPESLHKMVESRYGSTRKKAHCCVAQDY